MNTTMKGISPFYPGQPVPVDLFVGRQKEIEKIAWAGRGTDSYLDMLYPRLQLMKRLLAEGKRKRAIAVRVVDIFGNDAGATVDLQS